MNGGVSGDGLMATGSVPSSAYREYRTLAFKALNFDPVGFDRAEASSDWHVDRRSAQISKEAPGPPLDEGPFATARQVLTTYEFADPTMVRAVYDPSSPLEGRDMLLVGHFAGLRFRMGVRAGGVVDRQTDIDGRPAHVFGWHYRTLEDHLERGHMEYELVKWLESGAIDFNIRAYSQRADIDNLVVRLGFMLFGRREQLRFYDACIDRMQRIVATRSG